MAVSFGFQLATQPNKRGMYPVVLRITQNRKQKKIRTSFEVKKKDWNQDAKDYKHFRKSLSNSETLNQGLKDIILRYEETYRDLQKAGDATSQRIVAEVENAEVSQSFLAFAIERTQAIYDGGGIRNWKKYNGFCNKLKLFLEQQHLTDVTFAEVTPSFLAKFDTFLHKLPNARQPDKLLHQNTIQVFFNIFKTLVNRAINIEKKIKYEDNPFLIFKYSGVKTMKEKLEPSEIQAMIDLDLPEDSLIWHCRNYFLFSYYCAGIRVGDFMQLRWANITSDGRLVYQMGKNHKVRDIIIVSQALDILKAYAKPDAKSTDYIFPLLNSTEPWAKAITQEEKDILPVEQKKKMFEQISSKNARINQELAKIANLAGIEKKVSFHISRHSFARAAKERGLDNLSVKALLAHTNISTTERYMGNFDTATNDAALESVFEPKEQSKKEQLIKQLSELSEEQLQALLNKANE